MSVLWMEFENVYFILKHAVEKFYLCGLILTRRPCERRHLSNHTHEESTEGNVYVDSPSVSATSAANKASEYLIRKKSIFMTTDVILLESIYLARGGPRHLVINEDWSRRRKHKNTQIDFHKTQISKIDVLFCYSLVPLESSMVLK